MGRASGAAFATEQGQATLQISATAAQNIAFRQQRRQVAGQRTEPQRLATQQQMGDTRMARQLGHGLAMGIECTTLVQRAEAVEQIQRLGIGCWRWHIEPAQLLRRHAPAQQLQSQAGQIGLQDFRAGIGAELFVLRLRPQAVADARLQAPGTTGTLSGRSAGDALGVEACHAAGRVEARHPRQAGIDDHAHAVDGQAGLGDVGRQHHLAFACRGRLDGRTLGSQVQFAVQRADQHIRPIAQRLLQLLGHAANLGLAGQEHQQAAGFISQRLLQRLQHARFDPLACLERRPPADIHREHAPFAAQHRRITKQCRQTLAFESGGHQQHLERRLATVCAAEHGAAIERQRQGQIGIEAALHDFATCTILSFLQR